jgi:threonine dehydratase
LHGNDLAEARTRADELAQEHGLTYIHGYDDAAIIAGQGTIGLEILEQVPDIDAIVASIGGGGMIAGVALAVKSLRPEVRVIGVEPEHAACYSAALAAGEPVNVEVKPTLADGLAVSRVGPRAFEVARPLVDRVVTVGEADLAIAMLRMIELDKRIVEGAGAAPLAPFLAAKLSARLPELAGKRVVLVLSGGNVDLNTLDRVIEVGLVHDARICRFTAVITDRPGGLAGLAGLIASTGASIKDITHDRCSPDLTSPQCAWCARWRLPIENTATRCWRRCATQASGWNSARRNSSRAAAPGKLFHTAPTWIRKLAGRKHTKVSGPRRPLSVLS